MVPIIWSFEHKCFSTGSFACLRDLKIGTSRVSGLMDGGEMKRYHATLARMCFVTFYLRRS